MSKIIEIIKWRLTNHKWVYKPFWYLKWEDDFSKGARCSICNKFIKREDSDSLQVHEMEHWD